MATSTDQGLDTSAIAIVGAEALLLDLRRVDAELRAATDTWTRAFSHHAYGRVVELRIGLAYMVRAYSTVTHSPVAAAYSAVTADPQPAVLALLAA